MKGRKKLRASVSLLILRRKALAFALAFALVLSTIITMVPMLEVKAEEDYSSYVNTTTPVEFNGNVWYIIEYDSTAETVTLLSKECVGASKFSDTESNEYSGSLVETAVKTYYDEKFLPETKTAIINDELFLLTSAQASALETANINVLKCSKAENALSDLWWLCSSGSLGNKYAAGVFGDYGYVNKYGEYVASACGVRPALKLDLSKVTFESDTFTVGASQSNEEETWEYPTSAPENPFDGGDGSANNPYEIATAQQLANLAWLTSSNNNANTYRTANYVLKNDINLGNKEWTISIGERKFFNGVFDGAGHTVSGLYINRPENYDSVGLFYEINDDNAVIKGLTVTGSVIGYIRVGGIVGCCRKGTIENCVNVCNVTGIYGDVGGICGYNRATVTGCDNLGNIIAPRNVGGICGELYVGSAVINNCSNSGSIEGNDANSNGGDVGGICGYLSEGTISRCYNTGIIRTNSGYVGGIAGDQRNSTTIECCYNSGSVMNIPSTRGSYVGGITGSQYNGIIQNCYNTGDITYVGSNGPGYVAGISACTSDFWSSSSSSIICNCYNFGNISISDNSTDNPIANNMGGIDGYDSSDSNNITHNYCLEETCDYIWGAKCTESVSGKYEFLTSTQFTDTNNFTGWDFETDGIWKMSTILGRPVLNGVGEGGDVYTVTFDSNDGSDVSSQMVVKNKVATEPTAPTKGGYVFGGWCSDSALTTAYDFSTAVSADITLYAKWLVCVPDVSATGYDDEFDGDEHSITVTAPEGATITYGETEGNYTSDNPSYKNVGEKTVYYKVTKDGYEPFTGSATVKITQKTIGIEWTNTAFTYNGNSQKPTATATGLVIGETCTITVTGEESNANVGETTYTATASSIDNANYKLPTANTTTFTISPASVTVSGITASNKSYDGNTTAILNYDSAVFAGVIGSDVLTVAATGTFADSKPGQNKTVNITGLTLGGTSAANYVLTANGQQESTTADITIETGTVIETIGNADESTTVIKTEYEDGKLTGSTETTTSADEKTVTVVTKDADGYIVSTVETVTNTDGSTIVTEKNSSDNVTKETVTNADDSKKVTEYFYDNAGDKTGSVVTTTSADGKIVTVEEKDASDKTTKTTVTEKDSSDTMVKTTVTVNNSDGTKTITETNVDGSSKVTEKNSSDKVTKETVTNADESKKVTEYFYDNAGDKTGSVVTITSADGKTVTAEEKDASDKTTKTTVTEKDSSDTMVKTTVTVNNSDGTKTITETNVDGSSKVTEKNSSDKVTKETVTNADGSKEVTENSYDNAGDKTGSVVTTTSADGKTVTVETKDSEGNTTKTVETVTNADESSKVTEKDEDGKVMKETVTNADESKVETENSYDSEGNKTGSVVTTTSADGKTVTVEEKDASDATIKTTETVTNDDETKTVTTIEGNTTTVKTKDNEGNVTKTVETVTNTDGSSVITETSYDDDGNVTGTKETTFDKDGEVESVVEKDADGNIIESGDDDNQGDDNQGNDNQGDDNQGDDKQGDDSQGDDKQGDDSQGDDKQGDDKQGDDKQGDDNQGDDSQGDDSQGDDKQSDDKQGDDKQGDDKQSDDKQSDDKQSDDKPSDDKKDDTKSDDVKPATQKAAEVMESSEKFAEFEGETFYKNEEGDVYCIDGDGNLIRDAFVCDGTYTYYVQYDYSAMRDRLTYHPDGEHIIYFDSEGHEVFNDFAHVKHSIAGDEVDDYCFFDVYGHLYVDVITWDKTGAVLYYANPYGVMEMNKWFQFSDTVVWGDGTPTEGIAGGYGYANEDGTLMKDQYTYDWEGRFCYMQGNGTALY